MAESINHEEPPKQCFCNNEGERYIAVDGKSLKESRNVYSCRDYLCETCGRTFTQCHTLHIQKKYHYKMLKTEKKTRTKNVQNAVKW